MSQNMETTSGSVNGPSCSYASLQNYNNASTMDVPVPRGTVTGMYVVPNYGAPGYNTLSHDSAPSCSGYFGIGNAYRNNGGGCNQQYVKKLCQ